MFLGGDKGKRVGGGERLHLVVRHDVDRPRRADGHRRTQHVLAGGIADRHGDDLGGDAAFPQPHRLVDGDFIVGIEGHANARKVEA